MDEKRDTLGRVNVGGNAGAYAARTPSQRGVLGHAGVIGDDPRTAVAFAYCAKHRHVHTTPARSYSRESMATTRGTRAWRAFDERVQRRRPMDAVGADPTVHVRAFDPFDGTRGIDLWRVYGTHDARVVGINAMLRAGRIERTTPAHRCPAEHRDRTPACDCDAMGRGVRHDHIRDADGSNDGHAGPCTRMHANVAQQRVCASERARYDDDRRARYLATVARINARERAA